MGINPLGSNKKARTTLVFDEKEERNDVKNALSDIASSLGISPSQTVLALVLESLAKTDEARDVARTMYAFERLDPKESRCLEGLELILQDLAANGEEGRDSEVVLKNFLDLALRLGLSIDTNGDDARLLLNQWSSITEVLENASKSSKPEIILAARDASDLGSVLDSGESMLAISPMLACLARSWELLRNQSCAFRALCYLAHMASPTRTGIYESPKDRLAFLHTADMFYATSGEEADV